MSTAYIPSNDINRAGSFVPEVAGEANRRAWRQVDPLPDVSLDRAPGLPDVARTPLLTARMRERVARLTDARAEAGQALRDLLDYEGATDPQRLRRESMQMAGHSILDGADDGNGDGDPAHAEQDPLAAAIKERRRLHGNAARLTYQCNDATALLLNELAMDDDRRAVAIVKRRADLAVKLDKHMTELRADVIAPLLALTRDVDQIERTLLGRTPATATSVQTERRIVAALAELRAAVLGEGVSDE